ncbi:hypothetical protein FRZ61_30030 [Hypericibacter adhaerens]|uniref:Uncharacterized protein n=1 Tax=Hypericibacter adhaerens TaxID=2602016 RepID=A0A5J6MZ80_9PROT|nr:hypothetical protein FRZ61_30030 [Hypericibacter adhaerens]
MRLLGVGEAAIGKREDAGGDQQDGDETHETISPVAIADDEADTGGAKLGLRASLPSYPALTARELPRSCQRFNGLTRFPAVSGEAAGEKGNARRSRRDS